MRYLCRDTRRRADVAKHPTLNGIDFLEVLDDPALPDQEKAQRLLAVHFIKPLQPAVLKKEDVRVAGGERIRDVQVTAVTIGSGDEDHVLNVAVDRAGDFSTYALQLVGPAPDGPPAGFDMILSTIEFSFKAACPSPFDCRAPRPLRPAARVNPDIDYLAKDYASFRRLMFDRLSAIAPQWTERHSADIGVALVEALAYAGDHLSYQQDAIATEAYLGTARRRTSVRRHARLVDYFMHDGCNARAWVHVKVDADNVKLEGARFLTRVEGLPARIPANSTALDQALAADPVVFEALPGVTTLYMAHNEMPFWTWGDRQCRLPRGATNATLKGHYPGLKTGGVLIFEEVRSPRTGLVQDADPSRRHAVRLTAVECGSDAQPLTDPLHAQPITEIAWAADDALPFRLCVSAKSTSDVYFDDLSVARGNIVLADHGLTIVGEPLGTVQSGRFRPMLQKTPLTQAASFDASVAAAQSMRWSLRDVAPALTLRDSSAPVVDWHARRALLSSDRFDRHIVAEVEDDGKVSLRFGDDRHGRQPLEGWSFTATYRVGNGAAGNLGAGTLAHIVTDQAGIVSVRNPLPAGGGVDPESIADVRDGAPSAFRTQERAVTEADYAAMAERQDGVQRAAATFRWTGSWHTVFLTADRGGGAFVDEPFTTALRRQVEPYRMAGCDLDVDAPRFVPLEIELHVCVAPEYFRSDVGAALLDVFSSGTRAGGGRGMFHPDNFTFGQAVYSSPLYAAAQSVDGVDAVRIIVFQRQGSPASNAVEAGRLEMGRLEIARLDNDPNFPEHGVLRLTLEGGK
jgi:baseplate J-like protein